MSEDKVIQEKRSGEKASWELPAATNGIAQNSFPSSSAEVPPNYGNSLPAYEEPSFEVKKKTPGRLG